MLRRGCASVARGVCGGGWGGDGAWRGMIWGCLGAMGAGAAVCEPDNPLWPRTGHGKHPVEQFAVERPSLAPGFFEMKEERRKPLGPLAVFAGTSHPELAKNIAENLNVPLGAVKVGRFKDGEVCVELKENVRGKDCYVVQPTCRPANDNLLELLLLVSALRRNSAGSVTAVVPYFGYSRDAGNPPQSTAYSLRSFMQLRSASGMRSELSDEELEHLRGISERSQRRRQRQAKSHAQHPPLHQRRVDELEQSIEELEREVEHELQLQMGEEEGGEGGQAGGKEGAGEGNGWMAKTKVMDAGYPIAAADVARLLTAAGVDNVIVADMNAPKTGRLDGFFPPHVSFLHVRGYKLIAERYASDAYRMSDPVVVSPNEINVQLAMRLRKRLHRMTGRNVGFAAVIDTGTASGGIHRYLHDPDSQNLALVGDVRGKEVILVDTVVDSGGTLCDCVELLHSSGAKKIYAFATHGLFHGEALRRIADSHLDEIVVTDTVPLISRGRDVRQTLLAAHARKLAVISVAPVFAEAILRLHNGMSLSHFHEAEEMQRPAPSNEDEGEEQDEDEAAAEKEET